MDSESEASESEASDGQTHASAMQPSARAHSKRKSSAAASGGRPSEYTCSECDKRYSTSSNLSRHNKQTHRSLDSQSAKRRAPAADVGQRENLHPQQQRPPATTAATSETVAYTYEALSASDGRSKRKSSAAASGGRPSEYTCSECGKRYSTSSNLSRHKKQTHRSLDSQSAKRRASAADVGQRENLHALRQRPPATTAARQCNVCGQTYANTSALCKHQLSDHMDECDVWDKTFSASWLLQDFLRSHTGEKPYICARCGISFAYESNLRVHMQTHPGDQKYMCPLCFRWIPLECPLNEHLESECRRPGSGASPAALSSLSSLSSTSSSASSSSLSPSDHQPPPVPQHQQQQHPNHQ